MLSSPFRWLRTGDEAFAEMLQAIHVAKIAVRLEMYIYHGGPLGRKFAAELAAASRRGARVRVLLDGLGSYKLPDDFWAELKQGGGEVRWFNRTSITRLGLRNHRKILVCDDVGFIGGFNIAHEYEGDGVTRGWRDLGGKISGALVGELAAAFDDLFAQAAFKPKKILLRRKISRRTQEQTHAEGELLLCTPGALRNPIKRALLEDLRGAQDARILCAYFFPTRRIRLALQRIARRGGKVQLILAGKSDVPLSQMAARSLYRRMMLAGIEIYEYQPQILHAKMFLIGEAAYAGSCNLDTRSLFLNHELLVRFTQRNIVREGRKIFEEDLAFCRKIDLASWWKTRTFWERMKGRFAHFVLVRLDPWVFGGRWKTGEA